MSSMGAKRFENSADENVEEKNREGTWPIYDRYKIIDDPEGRRICAPRYKSEGIVNERRSSRPLHRSSASLFLKFSDWPVKQGMDKALETIPGMRPTLDTDRNAAAAKKWAETFGVLGLGGDPSEIHSGGSSGLHRTTATYTGAVDMLPAPNRACRKSTRGGTDKDPETVGAFAFEAWQAYLARRLYELAAGGIDEEKKKRIVWFMDDMPPSHNRPPGAPPGSPIGSSEREIYSIDEESIRDWALDRVGQAVMLKVENTCYPTLAGTSGSYEQGWGFKSLLGAAWLQMMWLMLGDHGFCRRCGSLLDRTRRDKRFCDNNGKCRAAWNYHNGAGKSSKAVRRQARYKRES